MVLTNNNNNYELYLITDQRGEHNGTPLNKTMFYRELILFKQAGALSRYAPGAKYRLRPCSIIVTYAVDPVCFQLHLFCLLIRRRAGYLFSRLTQ